MREKAEEYMLDYNNNRPHSDLNLKLQSNFWKMFNFETILLSGPENGRAYKHNRKLNVDDSKK